VTVLYFAGAEQPSHRNLLAECGVNHYAINITNLNRLVKPGWDITEHLPVGALWIAYADDQTTWDMAEWVVEQQPHTTLGPLEWRDHFAPGAPYGPFWGQGVEPNVWPLVGLTDATVKSHVTLRRIMNQYASSILVAVTGAARGVERLDVVVSYAWTMAQRYGETHVWAGNKMHRYAGQRKAEARPRHRGDIERLGIDYERIAADDPTETARLAVRSWQEWGERYSDRNNVTLLPSRPRRGTDTDALSSNDDYSDQDGPGSGRRALALVGSPGGHEEREQTLLPGLDMHTIERTVVDGDGVEQVQSQQTVVALGASYRTCNTCYLAANCPAFKPNHTCAFKIPVEVRTKDQLQATMQAVVEMQMQRVAFARFAEQVDGQGIDGALSGEIDRLFGIMAKMKDILDDKDVFRFQMEAKAGNGVLSRLFGEKIGEAARALPIPVTGDEVLHQFDP
jgi:hypothetical protein